MDVETCERCGSQLPVSDLRQSQAGRVLCRKCAPGLFAYVTCGACGKTLPVEFLSAHDCCQRRGQSSSSETRRREKAAASDRSKATMTEQEWEHERLDAGKIAVRITAFALGFCVLALLFPPGYERLSRGEVRLSRGEVPWTWLFSEDCQLMDQQYDPHTVNYKAWMGEFLLVGIVTGALLFAAWRRPDYLFWSEKAVVFQAGCRISDCTMVLLYCAAVALPCW